MVKERLFGASTGADHPLQPASDSDAAESDAGDHEAASALHANTSRHAANDNVAMSPVHMSDSECSDDEDTSVHDSHGLDERRPMQQPLERPPGNAASGVFETPSWLADDPVGTMRHVTFEDHGLMTQPKTSCAQSRARNAVLAVQSRPPTVVMHTPDLKNGCPVIFDGANLWSPLCTDLALPFLYGDADRVRQAALVPPGPGEVTQCLLVDSQHLPLRMRDIVLEDATPTVPQGTSGGGSFARHAALWIFGAMSPVRRTLFLLMRDPAVRTVRAVGTCAAVLLLAIENPRMDPAGQMADRIKHADMTINVMFALELAASLTVYGGVAHPGAYFRRPEGWIHAAALVGGVVGTLSNPRQLRVLRCLRCDHFLA